MNRKLMTAVLCCALIALTACGGKKEKQKEAESQNAAGNTTKEETAVEKYTPAVHEEGKDYVGIIQQSGNESLTLASEGFRDELEELMGDEVVIDYKVADGTDLGCDVIIDHFLQDKDDLILAGGTMALRQAYSATKDTPIVAMGVTDFLIVGAGVSSVNEPGGNVTGISDLPPMESQRDYLVHVAGGSRIGIVYCSEEINSGFQCRHESELESVITKACEECGTLYLPNDDKLARNMDLVKKISLEKGTKVFGSDENMCKNGALASYGIDYYEMGKRTANVAYDVMIYGIDKADEYNNEDDEADDYEDRGDISRISIDRMRDTAVAYYNPVIAEKLGWTPDGTYTEVQVEEQTPNAADTAPQVQGEQSGGK